MRSPLLARVHCENRAHRESPPIPPTGRAPMSRVIYVHATASLHRLLAPPHPPTLARRALISASHQLRQGGVPCLLLFPPLPSRGRKPPSFVVATRFVWLLQSGRWRRQLNDVLVWLKALVRTCSRGSGCARGIPSRSHPQRARPRVRWCLVALPGRLGLCPRRLGSVLDLPSNRWAPSTHRESPHRAPAPPRRSQRPVALWAAPQHTGPTPR